MIHFCYVNTLKNEYNNLRGDIKNNKKLHRTRTTLHNKTFFIFICFVLLRNFLSQYLYIERAKSFSNNNCVGFHLNKEL